VSERKPTKKYNYKGLCRIPEVKILSGQPSAFSLACRTAGRFRPLKQGSSSFFLPNADSRVLSQSSNHQMHLNPLLFQDNGVFGHALLREK
jgi:hypothetical protein